MRSYYAHLKSLGSAQAGLPKSPTLRTSAILPVIQDDTTSTRALFMGYWKIKRNISPLTLVITLRDQEGRAVAREIRKIDTVQAFRVEVKDYVASPFVGSMELEFFSLEDLVFPYPAVVLNYYGITFSSVVHMAERVYNNPDDYHRNSTQSVPESGFNLYADADHEPFITLINGPMEQAPQTTELRLYTSEGLTGIHRIELPKLLPYSTHFIDPSPYITTSPCCGSFRFKLDWVYPRLIVGNRHLKTGAVSITHSYYDCSQSSESGDYWAAPHPNWHGASLLVPVNKGKNHLTQAYFYPIYSPSSLTLSAESYTHEGELVSNHGTVATLNSPLERVTVLNLNELGIDADAVRLMVEGERLPARVKMALDIGKDLPSNICVNLHPFAPQLDAKSHCFRWAPLMADSKRYALWIMNSAPHRNYQREARLKLSFFRESDEETIERRLVLPPHGSCEMIADQELNQFFEGKPGWCTVIGDNPFVTTYYFVETPQGSFGGDHGF